MPNWTDRLTGRVTMYRLVLLSLVALALASLLLSAMGELFYTPLAILASGAVIVAATYLSNRLFAAVLRLRPHSESSIITGLLLLFIFRPSLDPATLAVLALAGIIASASKFVLAVRRRHIFNPAAISAVIVGVLGLDAAAWWVATPGLLPIVALGAFAILQRTRRLPLGVVFVALSTAIYAARLASFGTPIAEAATTALTSIPIVFFVGFMLSEPLTLPPRRWQQLVLAVLVAVLFAVPFELGPIHASPELALVVGNALAFFAGQRRGIRLDFLGREQLSPTSWQLSFQPHGHIGWRPGQHMELTLPHHGADLRGLRRMFTIASAPSEGIVRFGLRVAERSSSFKQALFDLRVGESIAATSVSGDFVLPTDATRPLLLVAGGIGITPFISQLGELESAGERRDVVVVYSCSRTDDIPYADRLERLGHPVLLVASNPPDPLPEGWRHLGSGPLTADTVLAQVVDVRRRATYLSGPPQLVNQLRGALRRAGVRRIRTDYFSGY